MKSVRDRLEQILPSFLPASPDNAILAHHLLDNIKHLFPDVSQNSIKQSFSIMAADPRSCLAKRPGQHGYFKRPDDGYNGTLGNVRVVRTKKSELKKLKQLEKLATEELTLINIPKREFTTIDQREILLIRLRSKKSSLRSGRYHPVLRRNLAKK